MFVVSLQSAECKRKIKYNKNAYRSNKKKIEVTFI